MMQSDSLIKFIVNSDQTIIMSFHISRLYAVVRGAFKLLVNCSNNRKGACHDFSYSSHFATFFCWCIRKAGGSVGLGAFALGCIKFCNGADCWMRACAALSGMEIKKKSD